MEIKTKVARSPRTTSVCFCVVQAIDEYMERKFKKRSRVKFKDDISAE